MIEEWEEIEKSPFEQDRYNLCGQEPWRDAEISGQTFDNKRDIYIILKYFL